MCGMAPPFRSDLPKTRRASARRMRSGHSPSRNFGECAAERQSHSAHQAAQPGKVSKRFPPSRQFPSSSVKTPSAGVQTHSAGANGHSASAKMNSASVQTHSASAKMNSAGAQTHSAGANSHSTSAKMNSAGAQTHSASAKVYSADAKMNSAGVALWLSTVKRTFASVQPPPDSPFGQPEQLKPQEGEDPADGVAGVGAVLKNVEGVLSDGLIHQRHRQIVLQCGE